MNHGSAPGPNSNPRPNHVLKPPRHERDKVKRAAKKAKLHEAMQKSYSLTETELFEVL